MDGQGRDRTPEGPIWDVATQVEADLQAAWEMKQEDNANGGQSVSEVASAPPEPQAGDGAKPIDPSNRAFPAAVKHRPPTFNDLRKIRQRTVMKYMTTARIMRVLRSFYAIATDPKNRNAVAAGNALLDRTLGPVAQQMQLDVTSGGQSLENTRRELQARLLELYGPPPAPQLTVESEPAE